MFNLNLNSGAHYIISCLFRSLRSFVCLLCRCIFSYIECMPNETDPCILFSIWKWNEIYMQHKLLACAYVIIIRNSALFYLIRMYLCICYEKPLHNILVFEHKKFFNILFILPTRLSDGFSRHSVRFCLAYSLFRYMYMEMCLHLYWPVCTCVCAKCKLRYIKIK